MRSGRTRPWLTWLQQGWRGCSISGQMSWWRRRVWQRTRLKKLAPIFQPIHMLHRALWRKWQCSGQQQITKMRLWRQLLLRRPSSLRPFTINTLSMPNHFRHKDWSKKWRAFWSWCLLGRRAPMVWIWIWRGRDWLGQPLVPLRVPLLLLLLSQEQWFWLYLLCQLSELPMQGVLAILNMPTQQPSAYPSYEASTASKPYALTQYSHTQQSAYGHRFSDRIGWQRIWDDASWHLSLAGWYITCI